MFYQTTHSTVLRLGDVIQGFISTHPEIQGPCLSPTQHDYLCTISVGMPSYSVVLSPCCSIENSVIILTPLIKLYNPLFKLPYIREDPTRINSLVNPEYTVPPSVWNSAEFAEEKIKRITVGPSYIFNDYFVYDKNDIFEEYDVPMKGEPNIIANYYMIDFRKIYSLNCNMVKRESELTEADRPLIESKRLELSVDTRKLLRQKLSYYFWRPAPEDEALIA